MLKGWTTSVFPGSYSTNSCAKTNAIGVDQEGSYLKKMEFEEVGYRQKLLAAEG